MTKNVKQVIPVNTQKETKFALPVVQPISQKLTEMDRAFDRFLDRNWLPSFGAKSDKSMLNSFWGDSFLDDKMFDVESLRLPNLDIVDHANEIIVKAEVPGIEKKDIHVSISDHILTIKGQTSTEKKTEKKEEKGEYYRNEISSASFHRSINLPTSVDTAKVDASLKDGVLQVKLPKLESAKRQFIPVQ